MLITIKLPWYQVAQGKSVDVYEVDLSLSDLDGEVCTQGYAQSLITGERMALPPYIAASDIANYLQAQFGAEHGARKGAKLN